MSKLSEFDPTQQYGYYFESTDQVDIDEAKSVITEAQINRLIPEKYHNQISWSLFEPSRDTNYKWVISWNYTPAKNDV